MRDLRKPKPGQSLVEYALLLVLIAVVVIGALVLTGTIKFDDLGLGSLSGPSQPTGIIEPTPAPTLSPNALVLQDFMSRIQDFYQLNGKWPRTWKPYNFTDIGLNPDDYSQPINGLYWSPHGSDIGIANKSGDDLQVYVKKLDGTMQHLVDGWSIWCTVSSPACYFHTIAPGNEVDFSSIIVSGK